MKTNRRSLLKMSGAALLARASSRANTPILVPTTESLKSIQMTHTFGDLFNPPALTNFRGCAQAALDLCAVRCVSFPPLAQGEASTDMLGGRGDLTGLLFVDGAYVTAERVPIVFTWWPDRIQRRAMVRDLSFETTTIVPFDHDAVLMEIIVRNTGKSHRNAEVKLLTQGGVTRRIAPCWIASPGERDNEAQPKTARGPIVFRSRTTSAYSVQGHGRLPIE